MVPIRVLLTGAALPLSAAVAEALAHAGYEVRTTAFVPLADGAAGAVAKDFRQGPLTDPEFVAPLLEGVGAIVHLAQLGLPMVMAGETPGEILDAAARGTHVLLKAAVDAGIDQIVLGSTLAVMDAYGGDLEVTEQWRPRPRPVSEELAPYLSELTAREFTRDVQLANPPSIVCLRFGRLAESPQETSSGSPLSLGDAAQAVVLVLAALQKGARQRGHRWQLYHIDGLGADAPYTSAAAQRALGYGSSQPAEPKEPKR